jgi:5-methyltetrahydrofolate--homocysteine methyltransferase
MSPMRLVFGVAGKSAQRMVITAADLREAGIEVPLLVGGAALSEKFTRLKPLPATVERFSPPKMR